MVGLGPLNKKITKFEKLIKEGTTKEIIRQNFLDLKKEISQLVLAVKEERNSLNDFLSKTDN